MTACIFCGNKEIREEHISDLGLDHHHFQLIHNEKIYAICDSCNSIFRLDKNIPSFIDPDYIKLDRFPTKASSDLITSKTELKGELPNSLSHRNIQILNAIDRHSLMQGAKNICEFGANNGELLSAMKNLYDTELEVGVEIELFKDINYGYKWYGSITETLENNHIDLLIASHALVLTDYSEFISAIKSYPENVKNIIIVSQNPLNRPATLFYDDCISNPSISGKSKLLQSLGYNLIEAGFLPNHPYETIVIGSKSLPSKINTEFTNNPQFSIKNEKEKIWNIYKDQSKLMKENDIGLIFGTGIDSSLLAHQVEKKVGFAKDYVQGDEKFLGEIVLEINDIKDQKIIIPKFLSNSKDIFNRLRNNNINVYI